MYKDETSHRMQRATCAACKAPMTIDGDGRHTGRKRLRLHAMLHILGPKRMTFHLTTVSTEPFSPKVIVNRGITTMRNPLFRK